MEKCAFFVDTHSLMVVPEYSLFAARLVGQIVLRPVPYVGLRVPSIIVR